MRRWIFHVCRNSTKFWPRSFFPASLVKEQNDNQTATNWPWWRKRSSRASIRYIQAMYRHTTKIYMAISNNRFDHSTTAGKLTSNTISAQSLQSIIAQQMRKFNSWNLEPRKQPRQKISTGTRTWRRWKSCIIEQNCMDPSIHKKQSSTINPNPNIYYSSAQQHLQ